MSHNNRRSILKLMGGAALATGAVPLVARAQGEDLVVPNRYQNFKRGTIHLIHPEARSFTIVWEDLGRVKMKAADLVTNFGSLKVGQIVDVQWYDYLDFLVAKTTPAVTARAQEMLKQGARLEGIPGAQQRIRLWTMAGMATKVDVPAATVFLINASGGEPDKPSPNSGEIIQMPQIQTAAGRAALATLKVGEPVTTVFSQQTAIEVKIIR
ncbi:MAG: hypothetical protein JWQ58_1720 [Reyranella sp.]|nr:hypothetical protein [Reyranella sp.]